MNIIAKQFIETSERLTEIVTKNYVKTNPIEKAFYELVRSTTTEVVNNEVYESVDRAMLKGHDDLDLFLLFLAFYLNFNGARSKGDRMRSIYALAQTIDETKCHKIICAYYYTAIGRFKNALGERQTADEFYFKVLEMVPKESPRFITIISSIASLLAIQGRLSEIEGKYIRLEDFEGDDYRTLCFADYKVTNSFHTGEIEDLIKYLAIYKKLFILDNQDLIKDKEKKIRLLQGDFNVEHYTGTAFQLIARVYSLMLKGDFRLADEVYHKVSQIQNERIPFIDFQKYIPIHIDLNLRNIGGARLKLSELEAKGDADYIADFFRLRISLLEGDGANALVFYKRLMQSIHFYKATNRLLFEMQFAFDLSASDLFRLQENLVPSVKISSRSIKHLELEENDSYLVGHSNVIREVRSQIQQYADLKDTVYVSGETGTGKELVARALHDKSKRKSEPFFAINCGALTDTLLESELFGHQAGAFTGAQKERIGIFEAAGKGTVFLDEFGDVSVKMQAALLRLLESGEYRPLGSNVSKKIACRIVVASNLDLLKAVREKKFREDLYYRINRFDIHLPPLRNRLEDLPELIDYFLNHDQVNRQTVVVSEELINALSHYQWPGNVRELKNEIDRCKVIHKGKRVLNKSDFDFGRLQNYRTQSIEPKNSKLEALTFDLEQVNNQRVLQIIQKPGKADQRLEFLTKLFVEHKKLTRVQIMQILGISQSTASKDLDLLVQRKIIKKKMPSKSARSHFFELSDQSK